MLYHIYVSNMPCTISRKFAYADLALATQAYNIDDISNTLYQDQQVMEEYFKYWHLYPNTSKTTVTAFHLINRVANRELQVTFCGKPVRNEKYPKYLGGDLRCSLTYYEHLKRVA